MIVLIIGLGSIAAKHIQAIQALFDNVQIIALRSDKNAVDTPSVKSIFSLDELTLKPDFIIISNPTHKHYETIEQCVTIGAPLMIEKPVLENTEGYEKLSEKIKKANLLTYVACNLRFHPALNFLNTYLQSNKRAINEVNIYCGSYLPDWRPNRNFREIYSANVEMGGGVHLDLIHEIDYCLWLFGKPLAYSRVKTNKSSLNISAVDYAHYSLEYATFFANITLNYYRKDAKRQIEILFEEETWTVDLLKCHIVNDKGSIVFEDDFNILNTYKEQIHYFTNSINANVPLMNNFEEAIRTLNVCIN